MVTECAETSRQSRASQKKLLVIRSIATLGGLLFGYDTGVISGALPFLQRPIEDGGLGLSVLQESVVTSALVLGAALGGIVGGKLSDRYGRRHNIMVLSVIFFGATLGCALAPSTNFLMVFRFILGLAVGGASATVPVYLSEMAPASIRGKMVARNELMIVGGQLLAYTTNAVIATVWSGASMWRWMLALASIPAVALWVGVHFIPESPRWYASKGDYAKMREVLLEVRDRSEAEREGDEIERLSHAEQQYSAAGWAALKTPWVRRIVFVGLGLAALSQLTGVNGIMYYAPTILMQTGLSTEASLVATIANGVVSVVAVAIGIRFLTHMPRRKMILIGQAGVVLALIMLGTTLMLPESGLRSYAVLGFMLFFLFFMQCFIGVTFWLMLSEIFPLRVRGWAMGLAVTLNWIANFIVAFAFPLLMDKLGGIGFFIFAAINVLTFWFYATQLPETRGYSLEQLEEHFEQMGRDQ